MSLADHAAARDAATFVGRTGELAVLEALLADVSPHRVAVVTGAAGMGKTALLRELARRSDRDGFDVTWLDARELRGGRTTEDAVAAAAGTSRPFLVVDSAEELGTDEAWLREHGLAVLPASARVVLASRRPLEPGWWGSAWASSLVSVPVGPLVPAAATTFLAARGMPAGPERDGIVAWAEGHPLSLTLATAVRGSRGAIGPGELADLETDLLDLLTGGRLAGPDLVGDDRLVLAVAAIAPAVDADLLDAVIGRGSGDRAERWLRTLPFAERLGHRVTLHQRVRRLLSSRLRDTEPEVERALRLRVIDHLTAPTRGSRPQLVLDVRELLAPPQDGGVTPSRALASPWRVTDAQPDDLPRLATLLAGQDPAYAAWVARWVAEAPEHVVVVRDPVDADVVVAVSVWATDQRVPAALAHDAVLRPWLDATRSWRGGTLLNPVTELAVAGPDLAEVSALVLHTVVQRCGLADFRRWVVPRKPPAPDPSHCGGVADPSLDLVVGRLRLPVHVIDYGPGGAVGAMRDEAREVLAPPEAPVSALPASPAAEATTEDVREALRQFHDPVALSRSPLARGVTPADRAASVRDLLRAAIATAYGDSPDARLLREVLQRGYLDPDASHTRAMHALHLSRTTYFRRLREATGTLATWLAATPRR
ncbi:ATP-binding protein [Nocardioides sp.]|uniref:ATP-binding protein n=1 Tax=Nocardioides sp. TaxID=35761 RepID=UPI002723E021|nr:ATP-binding protein [Nocardioides sp.]MDO9456176.1 ATP-binding protein [Nocardioides sp.]